MRNLIIDKLTELQSQEQVQILIAVESGSRAWGFPSADSDYDVRFIYWRPLSHYLRLESRRDVIERPINDMLDISGWDLDKTLRLLHQTNPTIFEWLHSPIRYSASVHLESFGELAAQYFQQKPCLFHYLHMAEGNYREYLKGEMVRAKKYLYVLRPLLVCRWLLKEASAPPMLFSSLVETQLEAELKPLVNELVERKMSGEELDTLPRIDRLNAFIEQNLPPLRAKIEALPHRETLEWQALNRFFIEVVQNERESLS